MAENISPLQQLQDMQDAGKSFWIDRHPIASAVATVAILTAAVGITSIYSAWEQARGEATFNRGMTQAATLTASEQANLYHSNHTYPYILLCRTAYEISNRDKQQTERRIASGDCIVGPAGINPGVIIPKKYYHPKLGDYGFRGA